MGERLGPAERKIQLMLNRRPPYNPNRTPQSISRRDVFENIGKRQATQIPKEPKPIQERSRAFNRRAFLQTTAGVALRLAVIPLTFKVNEATTTALGQSLDATRAQVEEVYGEHSLQNDRVFRDLETKIGREKFFQEVPTVVMALLSGVAILAIPGSILFTIADILDKREKNKKLQLNESATT